MHTHTHTNMPLQYKPAKTERKCHQNFFCMLFKSVLYTIKFLESRIVSAHGGYMLKIFNIFTNAVFLSCFICF